MSNHIGSHIGALVFAVVLVGCRDSSSPVVPSGKDIAAAGPSFTRSTSMSKLLARNTFRDPKDQNFMIKRITDDWHLEIKAKPAFDLAVQRIVFPPHTESGWHSHPGPVFIQVVSGTVTFYESDDPECRPILRSAGQAYLDIGNHAHIARNETDTPDTNIVTYFAPVGADLRIDQPKPGNCPF